jgi:hypothetical protein
MTETPAQTTAALTLSGNDLAMAHAGAALAIAWWKERGRGGSYSRKEREKYTALIRKLDRILDHAYPQSDPKSSGEEPIVRVDQRITRRTRAAAMRAEPEYE